MLLTSRGEPRLPGTALIALSCVFFSVMAVIVRTLAGRVPSGQVAVVRFALGLVFMAAYFAVTGRRLNLGQKGLLAMRGVFGGLAVTGYFYAIEVLGVGPATMLNYLAPCYAAVFAALFLKERAGVTAWVGLVLATLGGVLVALGTTPAGATFSVSLGAIAGLLSGVVGGAAMTTVKKLRDDTDASTAFMAFNFFGLFIALPAALPRWQPLEVGLLPALLAIGLLSVAGQMLYTWAMAYTSVARGSATTQLTPVLAWAMGLALLDERAAPLSIAGGLLGMGGVLVGMIRVGGPATAAPNALS